MTGKPGQANDENLYAAPRLDDAQYGIVISRNRTGLIAVVNSMFLLLNFAIIAIGKSSLVDLLSEFDGKLLTISTIAYSIVGYWIFAVFILLGFSIVTTVAQLQMKHSCRGLGSYFPLIVLSIWATFTSLFAFGVLQPFYHVTMPIVSGLSTSNGNWPTGEHLKLTQGFYIANGKALVTLPFAVLRVAIFASALAREWR